MGTVDRRRGRESTLHNRLARQLRNGWLRAVPLALMWWVIAEGAVDSWLIGVPVVLMATLISRMLLPPFSWSLVGIVQFIPFFLWRSLYGGLDVARRALDPRLPISPVMYDYRWRLPPGLPRMFMANTVSLLPGTLSAELDEEYLCVHVLDQRSAFASGLIMIEERVAGLFGLDLEAVSHLGAETLLGAPPDSVNRL